MAANRSILSVFLVLAVTVQPASAMSLPCCCWTPVKATKTCCQQPKAEAAALQSHSCCAQKKPAVWLTLKARCCCFERVPATSLPERNSSQAAGKLSVLAADTPRHARLALLPAGPRVSGDQSARAVIAGPLLLAFYCTWLN